MEEIARIQEVMFYGVVFIGVLTFVGVLVSAWVVYLSRGTRETVRQVSENVREAVQILREVDARSERMGFYLFSKLGPADTK